MGLRSFQNRFLSFLKGLFCCFIENCGKTELMVNHAKNALKSTKILGKIYYGLNRHIDWYFSGKHFATTKKGENHFPKMYFKT